MTIPTYLDLDQARAALAEMGIRLTPRQMKRAADLDARGRRKLPFFIDPVQGRLRIERGALVRAYQCRQNEAESNTPGS